MRRIAIPVLAALLTLVAVSVALGRTGARQPAGPPLTLSPQPGTLDASPATQISLLGPPAADLHAISVTGSRSGPHAGTLNDYAAAPGASFIPAQRFSPGERVTVSLLVGSRRVAFKFTIARPAPPPRTASLARAPKGGEIASYVSRPDLHPPLVHVTSRGRQSAGGDIFLTPLTKKSNGLVGQFGPLILDGSGKPVWALPTPPGQVATNLQLQTYGQQHVLTWWQGRIAIPTGVGTGEDVIADNSYRTVAVVRAGNGYQADMHDFLLNPDGTAVIPVFSYVHADLSPVGGRRNGALYDAIVQQIDVKTGLVMFEWHALGRVPLRDSYMPRYKGWPYDPYHVNSIARLGGNQILVSLRDTWSAYAVSTTSGRILWRVGGKRSSFKLGRGARFAYQHAVFPHAGGRITIFDNEGFPHGGSRSRAIVIRLSERRRTATLVRQFSPPVRTLSATQGNVQPLPGGDTFVGWGALPFFTQYNRAGRLVLQGRLPGADNSYRAYRFVWNATPAAPPDIAVRRSGAGTTVYASWNGATGVSSWQVLAGSTPSTLAVVKTAPRTGFETAVTMPSAAYFAVRALGRHGEVLGTSAAAAPTA